MSQVLQLAHLVEHDGVADCAVVGVPDESHGEEIKAFVIRQPGATVTEDELIAWAKEQMAAYKYPRLVQFVESLPMTATGKILWQRNGMSIDGEYEPGSETEARARGRALSKLVTYIVDGAQSQW